MTFSKHNWNQLSESSKAELKRRQGLDESIGKQQSPVDAQPGDPAYQPMAPTYYGIPTSQPVNPSGRPMPPQNHKPGWMTPQEFEDMWDEYYRQDDNWLENNPQDLTW